MAHDYTELKKQFLSTFPGGDKLHVIRAPGRVNLIGEHTDYNDGFVFPMAIEPQVSICCRARTDGVVRMATTFKPGEVVEFSLQNKIAKGPKGHWANYMRGVASFLEAAGVPLTGMDMLITNTLPVGGGLSSSAAIEVGTGTAFLTISGDKMDPGRLALICQQAEHKYADVPCGIMDQTIVASGRAGHAMLLDCRDLSKHYVAIDSKELRVVICNSMVRHELSGGEYAERRKQCEEGVAVLKKDFPTIKALRDVTLMQLQGAEKKLDKTVFKRCRHVISENDRTQQAANLLGARRYEEVGKLMCASHASLRDDYEVSCVELDFLVDEAMKVKGVYGARMTGGGFGGCIVAIVQPKSVATLSAHLKDVYSKKYKHVPTLFDTGAMAGASVVE